MFELYPFIREMINCETTIQKMEVFNRWNLNDCRVFLFDEEKSNFSNIGKSISYGKFNLIGLGDYQKIWVIDKNTVNAMDNLLPVIRIVNYDLNIFTYIHNLFRGRNVPDKENLITFLHEIKSLHLTNDISTALMERYTTPINRNLLARMIESYVYFDSINFEIFQTNLPQILAPDKYIWMKEIWDDAEAYLSKDEAIQQYEAVCCYILKAFILKNKKNLSTEAKVVEFKRYCFEDLCVFLELEMSLLIMFLKNDSSVQEIFKKLQVGAKGLIDKIYNTVWDIFHIRLLEQSTLFDCIGNQDVIYLNYFATADSGLAEVLRANPIKMLVYYNEKIIPIRRYDALDFFTQDELDFYTTEEKARLRAEKVQSIDFRSIKERLISELGDLLTK
ncbi:hypothetical protein [Streptococcus pseudoporcinus]|uniref:Uncharacterized protein n=1 Tax=Streptococcus pseudoporcinus LQ 940-04 TaxID=875093 RepID=G5KAZ2_9STRE|nr:hypothetical protein [Streptococcus pseudoporcinus]EFR43784.1 hypothetical protein HMPREF9320_0339 [Streptococcus pseudoporcinus SPIN 20026]EHI64631.1 hypothetical protein STRPS_2105 [Streptococcus pseudoporcinus LQ 940-04]VEF93219.1 Uncharacterised protein [Streptococcus pseudoporcinus]